ncbi:MAG: thiamine pyrophosphate-dependent enzyme [Acidimicrobiia bacterium]|nr:thiamine pyrophosphate-dependent enzyme [Acidimicrobiia bacterium]
MTAPLSDPVDRVHQAFRRRVGAEDLPERRPAADESCPLTAAALVELFRSQVVSRHVDRMARHLRAQGVGYYTIGSSGHEGIAAVAAALRPTDMAFLHYRDGAFQVARARQVDGQDPIRDLLLSLVASSDDPISGGRHKVLGSKPLAIPPQTSTIASHLPKSVGAAYSIGLARRVRPEHQALADDGVVVCTFGDASLNHASAQAAINTAGWTAYQNIPLPLLFVCEDNGIGISVRTPGGWIEASMANRVGVGYRRCDGLDIVDTYRAATSAAEHVRRLRRPVFLHMRCVRLYGHAGADVEAVYRSVEEIAAAEADDPLLHSARILVDRAGLTGEEILSLYDEIDRDVQKVAEEVLKAPRLQDREAIMASIVPPPRAAASPPADERGGGETPIDDGERRAMGEKQTMAKLLNWTLADLLHGYPDIVLAGQDIGAKGGVYGVTQRLQSRFGSHRVIDTLLDEQSILGLAIGLAHNGFIPVPEIQFLAYLHNAEDQVRGEAATLPFFSSGQFTNPMVIRIASLGYQRGFGGHFHNDNSVAVLRDIPGLVVACPSNGADAGAMLREAVRLAREEQRIVAFLEPIARYATTDLLDDGDKAWAHHYRPPSEAVTTPLGSVGTRGAGTDLAIVTYGNGAYLAAQAQADLADHGIDARVIDIRWLAPLPLDAIAAETASCERILVVDECRRSGSASEAIMTAFVERGRGNVRRLCAADSFIATGPGSAATLPSRADIVAMALDGWTAVDRR